MKKVYQTINHKGKGDCFRACIASLLELKLEDVPDFFYDSDNPQKGFNKARGWLKKRNISLWYDYCPIKNVLRGSCGLAIYVGYKNKRSINSHAIIGKNGKLVFDPDPYNKNKNGIIRIDEVYILFPEDPAILIKGKR